jgi:putative PIN family toxin of toxin-antitoxin system
VQRIVLDANVIISAIVFGGASRDVLELAIRQEVKICISEKILDELRGVLRRPKFGYTAEQIRLISSNILAIAEPVETSGEVELIKADPDDNAILDYAIAAGAGVIVSGDEHLLRLGEFEGIEIVNPRRFLDTRTGPRR